MSPSSLASQLTDRADLTKRSIPHMVLNEDSKQSSLPPPPPVVFHSDPAINAAERFTVKGSAIVTGGTGALGLAASHALLEHGLSGLVIFDVNVTQSEVQLKSLRERFPARTIEIIQVDVTDEEAVEEAVEQAASVLGSVNHLLCFSGIVGCVDAVSLTPSQWRRIIDVNTTGAFICGQAVARQMIKQRSGGSIILTASISAHRVNYPQPQAAYNVSKAGLVTLKNCLAAEWACHGIRTNTISPGYMETILNEGDGIAPARRIWAERNPSGRLGYPSELTGAVILLSSDAGSYINGTDIVVDGGGILF